MRRWLGPPATPDTKQILARSGIHRILICHISHALGNALLLTPLIRELENTWPGAEIDIITRSQVSTDLYGQYDRVRRIFQLPAHGVAHPWQWLRNLHHIRQRRYDLAIDPDVQSQTSRFLLLKANAAQTLGFNDPRKRGIITHPVAVPRHVAHQAWRPVYLLRTAIGEDGASPAASSYPTLSIKLTDLERACGRQVLSQVLGRHLADKGHGKRVGIFANASGPKYLDTNWWISLLNRLEQLRPACHLIEIVPMSGESMLEDRYPSFFSTDIRQLGAVLANLDAYISLDCGIMHLASACGVSTLGIFTTTRHEQWQPYGADNHAIEAYTLTAEDVAEKLAAYL